MSLFEKSTGGADPHFPTHAAFLVPVEVRPTPQYGAGHHGVFSAAHIPAATKFWEWTDRIESIHHTQLEACMEERFGRDDDQKCVFLRQGFVLPGDGKDDYFHSNPTDAGRFMNHAAEPNCGPEGTLRDVEVGEELTMDYAFHGDPAWYRDLCRKYGVMTEREVAAQESGDARGYPATEAGVAAESGPRKE